MSESKSNRRVFLITGAASGMGAATGRAQQGCSALQLTLMFAGAHAVATETCLSITRDLDDYGRRPARFIGAWSRFAQGMAVPMILPA